MAKVLVIESKHCRLSSMKNDEALLTQTLLALREPPFPPFMSS